MVVDVVKYGHEKRFKMPLIVFRGYCFCLVWICRNGEIYKLEMVAGDEKWSGKFWKEIADKKAKIAADTYGGKTPQETLDMFISAVEKRRLWIGQQVFCVGEANRVEG